MISTQALHMALGQLATNDVLDRDVLEAMTSIPRERFVPPALAGAAYVDDDLPLGNGRFLLAPLALARMLQLAEVGPEQKILVVGCGAGYSLAVLARLAGQVIGCEVDDALFAAASANLAALRVRHARAEKVGKLSEGFPAGAPYDAIIVEGAVEMIPPALTRQLGEGGKLVTAERKSRAATAQGLCRLVAYTNMDGDIFRKEWHEESLPLLPGFESRQGFRL